MLTPYYRPLLKDAPNPDADDDGVLVWEGPFPSMPDLNPWCMDWVDLFDRNNGAAHGPGAWFPWQGFIES